LSSALEDMSLLRVATLLSTLAAAAAVPQRRHSNTIQTLRGPHPASPLSLNEPAPKPAGAGKDYCVNAPSDFNYKCTGLVAGKVQDGAACGTSLCSRALLQPRVLEIVEL
jgi:hypothetical protein